MNLDPTFVRSFPSEGYGYAWSGLSGAFLRDDLTIVNLECSPSNLGTPWNKPWTFRCDPEALPSMADAGVDVASLANNHGMDFGFEAMLDGKQNLVDVGIAPVGTGENYDDAYAPFVTEIKGDGLEAELFREYMAAWEDPLTYGFSHVGWGMNPDARWVSGALYDKRDMQAVEFRAWAGNFLWSTGANQYAGRFTEGHFDLPMRRCTIALDGQVVVKEGVLQGDLA